MARILLLGGLVGLVTGLVGAGGGFVIVPVLTLLAGLSMADAVGTSLFVIAVQSTAGLAGHLHSVHLNWPLTLAVTAAAIAGSLLGARLVGRVPQARPTRPASASWSSPWPPWSCSSRPRPPCGTG